MSGGGRRLLEALGDTTPAFTPKPGDASVRGFRRLLAALADVTLVRAGDEYRRRPARRASPGLVLAAVLTGLLAVVADPGMTGIAAVRIATGLGGFDQQAWVSIPFFGAALVTMLTAPRGAERWGTRRCTLLSLAGFVLGAGTSAIVPSLPLLAVTRTVQGAGAGAVAALAIHLIAQAAEPREVGRFLGYFGVATGVAMAAAPVLGGFAADAGWRGIFLGEAVLAALGLVFVAAVVPSGSPERRAGPRSAGLGAFTLVLGPLVVLAGAGSRWGWGSDAAVLCYLLSALGLVVFTGVQRSAGDDAVLPPRLLRERWSGPPLAAGFLLGALIPAVFVLAPVYLQVVRGFSPSASGLLVAPAALAMALGAQSASELAVRIGHVRAIAVTGVLLAAAGLAGIAWAGAAAGIAGCCALAGAGLGIANQTLTSALVSGVPVSRLPSVSTALRFLRQCGMIAGTGAYLVVLFAGSPQAPSPSLAAASKTAFLVAAGVALTATILVLFLRDPYSGDRLPPAETDSEDQRVTPSPGVRYYWSRTGF